AEWGFSDLEMRDAVNADALDLIEATVAAGTSAQSARKWWMGELARVAKDRDTELTALAITPAQVAELQGLVDGKQINDKIAKQVLAKVLDGKGDPAAIVEAERLAVVSDDSVLTAAVDRAIADNPDVVEDPGREGPGDRRPHRLGHEGHPRPGRRRPCARDHHGQARRELSSRLSPTARSPLRGPGRPLSGW